jgi:hypothetical protein
MRTLNLVKSFGKFVKIWGNLEIINENPKFVEIWEIWGNLGKFDEI